MSGSPKDQQDFQRIKTDFERVVKERNAVGQQTEPDAELWEDLNFGIITWRSAVRFANERLDDEFVNMKMELRRMKGAGDINTPTSDAESSGSLTVGDFHSRHDDAWSRTASADSLKAKVRKVGVATSVVLDSAREHDELVEQAIARHRQVVAMSER